MNTLTAPNIYEATEQSYQFPAVSIILPFNPKMDSKRALNNSLRMAAHKVVNDLYKNFRRDISTLVVQKLESLFSTLNFSTNRVSIAIYVSPVFEKVLYLNFPVEERIVVDDSFEIRDLLYSKKDLHEYLALLLSNDECRIYIGAPNGFVKILSNTTQSPYLREATAQLASGGESSQRKEIKTDKFLHYNDKLLDIILKVYHLPLFVLGNETITAQFKNLTKHSPAVIEYLNGNYETANSEQLMEIMYPHIVNWKKVKQNQLVNQLKEAACKKQLVTGLNNVCDESMKYRGQLLVVEKNYVYNSENNDIKKVFGKPIKPYNNFSCIKNKLDEIIEKVFETGGDVALVDREVLGCYDHIALIK
jgi:hypothetical protein